MGRGEALDSPSHARVSAGNVRASNISVAVRVRPIVEREVRRGIRPDACCWVVNAPSRSELSDRRSGEAWRFDAIFGPEHSTLDLFRSCGQDVVKSFCAGYNGTIFTYGQTASGKTFTMQGGGKGEPGIIPLAVDEMFETICAQADTQFIMSVSFVEIYNEQVFDLLSNDLSELRIFENAEGTVELQNCTKARVTTGPTDILTCLDRGNDRKHIGDTKMNERSSRSHTILQVHLESQHGQTVRKSQLNLVDLAGSEGLRHTEAEGVRRREGANINKSLFALSRVISSLSDPGGGKRVHVRFRDSKLTHLLKSSLGGNAQTVVVCTISPAPENYSESRSTLQFAHRAKNVQNKVSVNVFSNSDQCSIQSLKNDISELTEQLQRFSKTEPEALRTARAEHQGLIKDKETLENRIHEMESMILQSQNFKAVFDAQLRGPPVALNSEQRRRRTMTAVSTFGEQQPTAPHDEVVATDGTSEGDMARLQVEVQVAKEEAEDAERRLREHKNHAQRRQVGQRYSADGGAAAQKRALDNPSPEGSDRQQRQICQLRSSSMGRSQKSGVIDDVASHSETEAAVILISKLRSKLDEGIGAECSLQDMETAMTTGDMRTVLHHLCTVVDSTCSYPKLVPSCDSTIQQTSEVQMLTPADLQRKVSEDLCSFEVADCNCNCNLEQESVHAAVKETLRLRRADIDKARFQLRREKEQASMRASMQVEGEVSSSHVSAVQIEAAKVRAETRSLQDEAAAMWTKHEGVAADVSRLELELTKERSRFQRGAWQSVVAGTAHELASEVVPARAPVWRRHASTTIENTSLVQMAPNELCLTPSCDMEVGSAALQLKRHQGKLLHMQEEFVEADKLRTDLTTEVSAQQQRADVLVARLDESLREASSQQPLANSSGPAEEESARRAVLQQAVAEREAMRRQMEGELEQVARDVAQMRQQVLSVSQAEREEQSLQARRALLETERWRARAKALRGELELAEPRPEASCTADDRPAALSRLASVHRRRQASERARDSDGCQQQ